MTKLKTALLLGIASLGLASGQNSAKVTSSTFLVTQTTENGKSVEKLVDAGKGVLPNNILQMNQKLDNLSGQKLTGVRLTMPIPSAVAYQSQQCNITGVKAQFSADAHAVDSKTQKITNVSTRKYADAAALKKTVTVKENGKDVTKEVTVSPADFTAVRWQLPDLAAGQSVECFVRVKVK